VRIRNFGFLANRKRAKLLSLCFHLFGATPHHREARAWYELQPQQHRKPTCNNLLHELLIRARRQGWHPFETLKPKTAHFRKQLAHIVGQLSISLAGGPLRTG
jgi:hypothetical protein